MIKIMIRSLLSLLLLSVLTPARADDVTEAEAGGWTLARHDHHILAFLRQDPNRKLKSFRVETDIKAPPESMGAILLDFDHLCNWVFRCGHAELLKRISDTEYIVYIVHRAPYGIADRDTIIHGKAYRDDARNAVVLRTWEEQNYIPDRPHLIRMVNEELNWSFSSRPNGMIHIDLIGYADPGGIIPKWIDNLVQLSAPYYSVRGFVRMTKSPDYSNPSLPDDVKAIWAGLLQQNDGNESTP